MSSPSALPPHPPTDGLAAARPAATAAGGRRRPPGWLVALAVVLVVALAAASTVAVVQSDRLAQARDAVAAAEDRAARSEARAAQAEDRVAQLESQLAEGGGAPGQLPGSLEELLGGGLRDLMDPDGPLGDLGALGDLLGEEGLGGLLSGGPQPDIDPCLADVPDIPDVQGDTLQAQLDATAGAVEVLRGHEFPAPVDPQIRTEEEIRAFLTEEVRSAYPVQAAEQDRLILSALRAVPADIDLVATHLELLGDQVAGYYDDTDQALVVRGDGSGDPLGGIGLTTLAHELDHALVDAVVGLPPLDGFGDDEDGAVAALAVVEGGAVALQSQFQLAALSPAALLDDLDALAGAGAGLDDVPAYLASSLTFPYVAGPTFVCRAYALGGWDAVDGLITDPPATTHEVLFDGGGAPGPAAPELAGPEGYTSQTRRTFGAAQLSWLFAAPGDDADRALPDPVGAVRPWEAGEVTLWTPDGTPDRAPDGTGEDAAVGLALVGADLCDPVRDWWTAATGGTASDLPAAGGQALLAGDDEGGWGVVTCAGDQVRLGVGPTPEVAQEVVR